MRAYFCYIVYAFMDVFCFCVIFFCMFSERIILTFSVQVRSYCRGIVVRAVPPATRTRLFERLHVQEMASLRSFLDPPVGKGKTLKGSGKVGYHLHSRNSRSQLVLDGSVLHQQVMLTLILLSQFPLVLCTYTCTLWF
jgi:hypothetical protein